MNILLIGNGFDLAHGLPTKYTDFLEWIVGEYEFYYDLREQKDTITQGVKEIKLDIPEDKKRKKDINKRISHQVELWECIDSNIWFEYFLHSQLHQNSTWIDFESEISEVIQSIDKNMQGKLNDFVTQLDNWYFNKKFVDSQLDYGTDKIEYLKFGELRDRLFVDLNRLIRAFEIYLCEYVEKIECENVSPDIQEVYVDRRIQEGKVVSGQLSRIINFNYTNTFQRFYDSQKICECDYIHGKADINSDLNTNNMVLGIDEYLKKNKKNEKIEFIAFKKYYQRIYKGTGCKYKDWIDEIKQKDREYKNTIKEKQKILRNKSLGSVISDGIESELKKLIKNPPKHNLYIFGHSIDVTDKDILRDLIVNDSVTTVIYYFNKDDLSKKIINLVKVIGQDELIRRTGGSTKTIEFRLQKDMVKKDAK